MTQKAVSVLKNGGIIIFPTDTAFGIGCLLDEPDAIDRLFAVRKRPLDQATPVLVSSVDMARRYYSEVTLVMEDFMDKYWPGALTIIGKCDPAIVYGPVRGGTEKIGLRMPDHEIPLALIRAAGIPLLGPSANFHGQPTPYRFEDLDPELVKLADYVIPGECRVGNVSTVVDCTLEPYKIVRQGAVRL